MVFKGIDASLPIFLVMLQPQERRDKILSGKAAVAFPSHRFDGEYSAFLEEFDVLRHSRTTYVEVVGDGIEVHGQRADQVDDLAACRIRNSLENISSGRFSHM